MSFGYMLENPLKEFVIKDAVQRDHSLENLEEFLD